MPKTSAKSLKTKAAYNKKPEVQAKRVANNKARREALREGKVTKGDNKDVHHVKPMGKGGSKSTSNTKVVSRKTNRGWRKDNPEMYGKAKK